MMTPIQGRFLKDGSTEYRTRDRKVTLWRGPETGRFWLWLGPWMQADYSFPTRKAAIERIEQLLTA